MGGMRGWLLSESIPARFPEGMLFRLNYERAKEGGGGKVRGRMSQVTQKASEVGKSMSHSGETKVTFATEQNSKVQCYPRSGIHYKGAPSRH